MLKKINNMYFKNITSKLVRNKCINKFIKTINIRILYFLFIESYSSKKKKPPSSLCGSGVDASHHFHELKDSNLNPSVGEGRNADKTGEEKVQVVNLEMIEQIKPEE